MNLVQGVHVTLPVAVRPAGFVVFAALTLLTIYARPAPVTLGAHKLVQLEELLVSAGRSGWQV